MRKVSLQKKNNELFLDIITLQTYDDFDQILKYLQNQYNVKIEKQLDGPDMRISYLSINNKAFKLYNDPYGNTLSCSANEKELMDKITHDFDNKKDEKKIN